MIDMKKYKTFLFDFDYTIVDSSKGIVICFNEALKKIGQHTCTPLAIKKTIGASLEESFVELSKINSKVIYDKFRNEFINLSNQYMVENSKVYNNVEDLFKWIKYRNCNVGIVSSKDKKTISKIIKKNNLRKYVDIIIGENIQIEPKPSKESIENALAKLNSTQHEALYIGDCLIDAEAAQNANVDFFAVLTGTTNYNDFYTSGYDIKKCFNSIRDILHYFNCEGDNDAKKNC